MKKTILALLILFSLPAVAAEDDPFPLAPDIRACVSDSDCVLIEDVCPRTWTAVNRDRLSDFKSGLGNSLWSDCNPPNYSAEPPSWAWCDAGTCKPEKVY